MRTNLPKPYSVVALCPPYLKKAYGAALVHPKINSISRVIIMLFPDNTYTFVYELYISDFIHFLSMITGPKKKAVRRFAARSIPTPGVDLPKS